LGESHLGWVKEGIMTTRKRPEPNDRRKKSKPLRLSKQTLKDLSPKRKMPVGGRAHDDNCTRNASGCW
jgi:hypothetical protein